MIAVLMLVCSACSTTEKVESNRNSAENSSGAPTPSSTGNISSTTKIYKAALADNLKADASMEIPDVKDIPILQVAENGFDENHLLDVFLGSKDAQVKNNDGETDYTLNGKTLKVFKDSGSFNLITPAGDYINSIIDNMNGGIDTAFESKELDFMTISKATEQVAGIFNQLHITPHLPPKVYTLDYATLQREQDTLIQDQDFKYFVDLGKIKLKEKWNKEDEAYYMVFRIDIHGIPCTPTGYTLQSSEVEVPGSEVRVIVSKNGIESFDIEGSIYKELNAKANPSFLISLEQALDSLKKKFDTIILKDELTVRNISIMYVPQITSSNVDPKTGVLLNKKLEMIPAWCFNIEQKYTKGGKVNTGSIVVNINAVTGEEIL